MQTSASHVIPQDGLVEIEDGWNREGTRGVSATAAKGLAAIVVVGFLAVLFGTGVLDLMHPLEKPALLGRELERDQRRRQSANLWDGTLARVAEDDYALTSRVRERAARSYSRFLLEQLQETSGSVLIGPSGWMFDGQRLGYQVEDPGRAARRAAALIVCLDRRLASRGAALVPILIPRKSSIHADRLPFGVRAHAQLDWTMGPSIEAAGLPVVDLSSAFLTWEGPPIFRAADTHWSAGGMRVGAEEVARRVGLLVVPGERLGVLVERDELTVPRPGDLVRKLGLELADSDERHFDYGPWAVGLPANASEDPDGALLVGTSFSCLGFEKFLSHYLGRYVGVAAYGGKTTFQSLSLGLQKAMASGGPPSVIFAEFPNYQLLRLGAKPNWWTLPAGFLSSLNLVLPEEFLKLDASPRLLARGISIGEELPQKPAVMLVDLLEGELCQSGGVLELDLDLDVSAGNGALIIDSGTMRASLPLEAGRHRYVLPLVDDGALTSRIRLIVQDKGGLQARIHGLVFVSVGSKVEGSEVTPLPPKNGLHQSAIWPEPRRIQPRDALHLSRDECAALSGVQIQCFFGQTPVGPPWTVPQLRSGAPAVLSLSPLAGTDIDRVRVLRDLAGSTDPNAALFQRAFLSTIGPPPESD